MKAVNYSLDDAEFESLDSYAEIALKVKNSERLTIEEAKAWKNNLESF